MMKQFTLKSILSRLSLMFFILLCTVLASENAFSMTWKQAYKEAVPNKKDGSISIKIQDYYYTSEAKTVFNYLSEVRISYTEDGKTFIPILNSSTDYQGGVNSVIVKILSMKIGEQIDFPKGVLTFKSPYQLLKLDMLVTKYTKSAILDVKWNVNKSIKTIKAIRIEGKWGETVDSKNKLSNFRETFKVDFSKTVQKAPEESNNNVNISVHGDLITVIGVKSGDIIKVRNTFSGELQSVIAQGNVANIKVAKGQMYVVQVGEKNIKVVL